MNNSTHPIEAQRLENQRTEREDWRLGGPYLAQQAWGTVGADNRPDDAAWEPFDHDQARSRAYPWSEDGLEGLCDNQQRLCFAVALWNGRHPIVKEGAFGGTGNPGNQGKTPKPCIYTPMPAQAMPGYAFIRFNRMPGTRTPGGSGIMAARIEATHSDWKNEHGKHRFALVDERVLPPILHRMLDASQFLFQYGAGRVSRIQAKHRELGLSRGLANRSSSLGRASPPGGLSGGNSK